MQDNINATSHYDVLVVGFWAIGLFAAGMALICCGVFWLAGLQAAPSPNASREPQLEAGF